MPYYATQTAMIEIISWDWIAKAGGEAFDHLLIIILLPRPFLAAAGHGVNERTLPPATVDKQKVISLPQTQHPIMLHVCLIYMCVLCDKDGIKCLCIHMCSLLLFCARFGRDATERTTRVPFLPYSLRISFFIFTIFIDFHVGCPFLAIALN